MHGDIKGSNILVSPTVDALVADFGLAKLADSSTVPSLKGAGSLRWQSPEVLRGEAHRTFSSDVYSFGMTIYEVKSLNLLSETHVTEEKYHRPLAELFPLMA